MRRPRPAFTLIELLIIIAIIGVLIALLLPAVQRVRAAAERVECANHLRQIGLACQGYHDREGSFPPGYTTLPVVNNDITTPGWGWAVYLLPYVEQEPLYHSLNLSLPIEHPNNAPFIRTKIAVYTCPSDPGLPDAFPISDASGNVLCQAAPCSYAATWGKGDLFVDVPGPGEGIFYRNSSIRIGDIPDGTSNTTMIGDRSWTQAQGIWAGAVNNGVLRSGVLNPWPNATAPAYTLPLVHNNWLNIRSDPDGGLDDFASNHYGGVNMLFADGSVHFLANITSPGLPHDLFQAMGTRAGGEVVTEFDF